MERDKTVTVKAYTGNEVVIEAKRKHRKPTKVDGGLEGEKFEEEKRRPRAA